MKIADVKKFKIESVREHLHELERAYYNLEVVYIPSLYCLGLSDYELFTFKELSNHLVMATRLTRHMLKALSDKEFDQAQGFFNEYVKISKHIDYMILNIIPFESDATKGILRALR